MNLLGKLVVLATIIAVNLASSLSAQSKFVQPGAEWYYQFHSDFTRLSYIMKFQYLNDVIIGQDTCQKLYAINIYKNQNDCENYKYSYLKQKGDTVFFKNEMTGQAWEVLFNFNVPVGQTWLTKITSWGGTVTPHIILVDSTGTRTINGVTLKTMKVRIFGGRYGTESVWITERLGTHDFFFNFYNSDCLSDSYNFLRFTCYKDNQIGVYQMGSTNCSGNIGIIENSVKNQVSVSPLPASDNLLIANLSSETLDAEIYDSTGKIIAHYKLQDSKSTLDISAWPSGMYLLRFYRTATLAGCTKFCVQH